MSETISKPEAAAQLGISVERVRQLYKAGKLQGEVRPCKRGRTLRITKASVTARLEAMSEDE